MVLGLPTDLHPQLSPQELRKADTGQTGPDREGFLSLSTGFFLESETHLVGTYWGTSIDKLTEHVDGVGRIADLKPRVREPG